MDEIANLLAKKFIARPTARAVQTSSGEYILDRDEKLPDGTDGPLRPFNRAALNDHISGKSTYGHYLVDPQAGTTKLFAFDIDFEKMGWMPHEFDEHGIPTTSQSYECNPREEWRERAHPGRNFMKAQLMHIANLLASKAHKELEIPVAIAYSGYKGVHVYCFTGPIPALSAREGAELVLQMAGAKHLKGKNFYTIPGGDALLENLSVEVYPKQDDLEGGKSFGNLMRLPLGVNRKAAKDPTFFIDLSVSTGQMVPVRGENIAKYLENGDPWK